ncbi:Transcriptional regulator, ArsR family [Methanosarcina barkeri str. Wiesmoor]|uniref:Transcriptional regulator, ArsR family n=2 Tax=Methanosarcina barkeri TaxID=2208 RepID=A0A0E3QNE6_METBA|nr:winged helix-turn-helix domain-containing protein [Methanosarcina barkeri]AKB51932.1 Transcriptional regulator, ArsR family [Methanosarcina barkeri str. Wiesmoor]
MVVLISTKIGLMELVFRSERRRTLLIFLKDGPRYIDEIQEHLSVDSVSILPQLKRLKDRELVIQNGHTYELSVMGKAIVDKMSLLLDTLEVLEDNFDYWSRRSFEGIPQVLQSRVRELKNCKLIRPDLSHMFELDPEFVENLLLSKQVLGFSSYFHPALISLYLEIAKKEAQISLILTEPVLKRFKADYSESFQTLVQFEHVNLSLFPNNSKLAGFTVTDRFFLLTILPRVKFFENESLFSFDPQALKWGTDLFSYLQKEAVPVSVKTNLIIL